MQRWWLAAGGRAHELPRCDAKVVEGHAYALCGGLVRLVRRLFFFSENGERRLTLIFLKSLTI
jgi:hypothetical protein